MTLRDAVELCRKQSAIKGAGVMLEVHGFPLALVHYDDNDEKLMEQLAWTYDLLLNQSFPYCEAKLIKNYGAPSL